MGMLLVAISVQMFLDGLGTYLQIAPPKRRVGRPASRSV